MAKLRPRARIIRTIGDQLISGPEAALIELVKNAYDADSPGFWIKITPPNIDCPVGAIWLKDRGHGMSYDDIVGRWFEPATDDKLRRSTSPSGRRMLGAKGIGRFAASRLGSKTIIRSRKLTSAQSLEEVLVQIDWDEFSAAKYLDDIEIPIKRRILRQRTDIGSGVSMVVTDLRDTWTKKRLENLIRELRRVASPKEMESLFEIRLDLSEFTVETCGIDGNALMQQSNIDATTSAEIDTDTYTPDLIVPFRLQDYADYKLTGEFDRLGAFHGTYTLCKGDNKEEAIDIPALPLGADSLSCGPVVLNLNVYDREAESVEELFGRMNLDFSKIGIRAARQILTDNAGISIFRNGFRIRPYGEPENDWLELERMRVQDPSRKLGLSQVSGRVVIAPESVSGLIERSSREGLEHNGEFERLKELIRNVLIHVEQRRVAFREKAGLSRKRTSDVSQVKEIASLRTVSQAVAKLPMAYQEKIRKAIEKDVSALSASLEEIDEYQKILQSRASLGLVVAQVIHEGRRILNPMSTSAKVLFDHKDWVNETGKKGDIFRRQFPGHAKILKDGSRDMSKLFRRLDPVSGRRRGRPADFLVSETVVSSLSLFKDIIADRGIKIETEGIEDLTAYGYVEDFQAAMLNILENAFHWVGSTNSDEKVVKIKAKGTKNNVSVAISNNGPAVDPSYVSRLFQPGFSLKSAGTGLGLSIAREACRASKGDLVFIDDSADTCFVITFPANSFE